jgi:hypothetical protein
MPGRIPPRRHAEEAPWCRGPGRGGGIVRTLSLRLSRNRRGRKARGDLTPRIDRRICAPGSGSLKLAERPRLIEAHRYPLRR